MGLQGAVTPRYSTHSLLARLVERIRAWSFGILDRFMYTYRLGSVCNFDLDEHQHIGTNSELLLRIFRCSAYYHVFRIHHRRHDAPPKYSALLPGLHLHPYRTLPPGSHNTVCQIYVEQRPTRESHLDSSRRGRDQSLHSK